MPIDTGLAQGDSKIVEPMKAKGWLNLIKLSQKSLSNWQDKADRIDELYADLDNLASISREREFQLFWANVQVLGPSIYSQPPVPVVTPRFKDRRPLNRIASELLERCAIVQIETQDINGLMIQIRDSITTVGRGVPWIRTESYDGKQRICCDYIHRRDFAHDPARSWREVDWVARCAWLTKEEYDERFPNAERPSFAARQSDQHDDDGQLKAPIWEIWSKSQNKVIWIVEGIENVLDIDNPHLELTGFFPCPQPAYASVERGKLVPVPDFLFYKDQLEEINELTGRIGKLTEAIKMKGFYPAGAGEIGDAIEAAIKKTDNDAVLVGVSNWAMLGNGSVKDMIVWLPIEQIVTAVTALVELRKQLIDDVYQITGLSDIMRGSTVASETLGAQELKSQYGSIRIRDRQTELVRVSRDIVRLICEILPENFEAADLLEMSQMQIPSDKDIKAQASQIMAQIKNIETQLQQAQSNPEIQAMAAQNPEKAQEIMGQAQQQIQEMQGQLQKLQEEVTIEKVVAFLKDDRARSFNLDIETDSTIAPNENAQKQRATEYITAMSGFLQQAIAGVQQVPQIAPLLSDMIKFVNSQFRVGREMEQTIEEFADGMKQAAQQPKPNPEADAAAKQAEMLQAKQAADMQAVQAKADAEMKAKAQEAAIRDDMAKREMEAKAQEHNFKMETLEIERKSKLIDIAARREAHDQQMAQAKESHEASLKNASHAHAAKMDEVNAKHEASRED